PLMCASMTRTPRSPTTKPLLSTGGLFESRAYTPGASCFVSSRACVGVNGGGVNPFGDCAGVGRAKTIKSRNVDAVRVFVVLFINFLLSVLYIQLYRSKKFQPLLTPPLAHIAFAAGQWNDVSAYTPI